MEKFYSNKLTLVLLVHERVGPVITSHTFFQNRTQNYIVEVYMDGRGGGGVDPQFERPHAFSRLS